MDRMAAWTTLNAHFSTYLPKWLFYMNPWLLMQKLAASLTGAGISMHCVAVSRYFGISGRLVTLMSMTLLELFPVLSC